MFSMQEFYDEYGEIGETDLAEEYETLYDFA